MGSGAVFSRCRPRCHRVSMFLATRWVNMFAGCFSCFLLAFVVASMITALLHSSLVSISILPVLILNIFVQRKSIGPLVTVYLVVLPTTLVKGVYTTSLKRPFRHKRGASGALCASRRYAALLVDMSVPTADWCSQDSAVNCMHLRSQVDY